MKSFPIPQPALGCSTAERLKPWAQVKKRKVKKKKGRQSQTSMGVPMTVRGLDGVTVFVSVVSSIK